jgi:two-component system, chemotaxis family, chemotaxis protein CheY
MSQVQHYAEGRSRIVLVVDDNPAIRDMVSWALELDGYEPAEAAEGKEALEWMSNAAREGCYPSVILLDLAMPGMDGEMFLAQLRKNSLDPTPMPAIVVITAGNNGSNAATLGVEQVIVKPFHVRELLDVVRQLAV